MKMQKKTKTRKESFLYRTKILGFLQFLGKKTEKRSGFNHVDLHDYSAELGLPGVIDQICEERKFGEISFNSWLRSGVQKKEAG